jgi:hypothetical protein
MIDEKNRKVSLLHASICPDVVVGGIIATTLS